MMKNKSELKKILVCFLIIMIVFFTLFLFYENYKYKSYNRNYNARLDSIISYLLSQYPDLNSNNIITILNQKNSNNLDIWGRYGIDLSNDALILENEMLYQRFLVHSAAAILLFFILFLTVFLLYQRHRGQELAEITRYLEALNRRDYHLEIDSNSDDELSVLKSEIYKTTVLLKESAENSLQDKLRLKDSLSDISHQLKTPLTSVLVMLDAMLDDPDIDEETRKDFLQSIKKEVTNLNFFINAILKLSRFDANTVHFHTQAVPVAELIDEAAQNLSVLCDLRGVELNISGEQESVLVCDRKWQAEALTNIVKDCVEHSPQGSAVEICHQSNKLYCSIVIRDHGTGILAEDLPHIFERFYRGSHAAHDSIGIGLALAKSIIEAAGGRIYVQSVPRQGTRFEIRYDNSSTHS